MKCCNNLCNFSLLHFGFKADNKIIFQHHIKLDFVLFFLECEREFSCKRAGLHWSPVYRVGEMVAPGEEMRTTPVVQGTGTSDGRTPGKQNLFKQDVKQATHKVVCVDMMLLCFDHFQSHLHALYAFSMSDSLGKKLQEQAACVHSWSPSPSAFRL